VTVSSCGEVKQSGEFDFVTVCSYNHAMKIFTIIIALLVVQIAFAESKSSLYDIPLKDIDGKDTSLKAYHGEVLLVVNVASKCGYTPQYEALEAIQKQYQAKGFTVLGFPCNDFGAQEPGTPEEIKQFCSSKYDVTFPLFEKLHVKGAEQHPLYAVLTGKQSPFPGDIKWNFGKFIISRNGKILARFDSKVKPDSSEVRAAIESALAGKP
jgi:glutathione peroxidase